MELEKTKIIILKNNCVNESKFVLIIFLPKRRNVEWYPAQWKSAYLVCMWNWAHLTLGTNGGRVWKNMLGDPTSEYFRSGQ